MDHKIEWDRFNYYARRVQKLAPGVYAGSLEMSSFYCRIQSICPHILSFPQLRELKLWEDPQYAIIAAPLLPSSLRTLHVSFSNSKSYQLTSTVPARPGNLFLHSAARDAIGLIHLIVSGTVPSTLILFAVKGFDDIHNLDLSHMPQSYRNNLYREVIQTLSTKQKLTVLYLPLTRLSQPTIFQIAPVMQVYEHLIHLTTCPLS
jgi:hypothetical protein